MERIGMITVYISVLLFHVICATLTGRLAYFETLHHRDFSHVIHRRSLHTQTPSHREVAFSALGRRFHLFLQSQRGLLSPGFQAYAVDGAGKKKTISVDPDEVYSGYVEGEPDSSVLAYFEDKDLSATIKTPEDTYVIEPSWRHLSKSENYSMIAYRGSDMEKEFNKEHPNHIGSQFCGAIKEGWNDTDTNEEDADKDDDTASRAKRQTTFTRRRCPLLLVADYKFYEEMGRGAEEEMGGLKRTTTYLIALIARVNHIYRNTSFDGLDDFGFEIKEVRVHETATVPSDPKRLHYNMDIQKALKRQWDTRELLEVFGRDATFRDFCLAHLFTFQSFSGGVLGLAYIGSRRRGTLGGVCSKAYYKGGADMFLNTGWSSAKNRNNERILTQEADLVTAHEFGHNWGSEHDPDSEECSPNAFNGGKHIMYTYSVSGYEKNNKIFSPCSKRAMGEVLRAKSASCFVEPSQSYCGNYIREENEECDAGLEGKSGTDHCCTESCTLRQGAQCSHINHACCTHQCVIAGPTQLCEARPDVNLACEKNAYCNGLDKDCPPPPKKDNGDPCFDRGKCKNGRCQPFCETLTPSQIPCVCDKVEDSCLWCCQANSSAECVPFVNQTTKLMLDLPDGKPCLQGYCVGGSCKLQRESLTQRFWRIIEEFSADAFVEFMRANIVGTILFLSLFIWIPASCVVWRIDKKREVEAAAEAEWFRPESVRFVPESQAKKIRPTRRPPGGSVVLSYPEIKDTAV
ncbi:ADAM 17-like protease isoform X2 [Lingula anatina]|uniref:ADAM 17-like protease isoform X2 n=1 Tax=Lingula anatina TaxID=7574 RepID=A0A1S3HAQ7_LINAN|nr:ADAM 17-like protease isoform X2 [Lingula anatina]|eukprot:XP_013383117.1 ADAM 17-like protease isoform X2 [Lingula anatina]